MAKNQITDLLARLCGEPDELLAQVMAHRVRALQRKLGVPLLPTEFLNVHVTPQLAKANTIAAVMPLLQRHQYRIQWNHARYLNAPYPPWEWNIFKDAAPALYAAGMYWMSSVTAPDGERLCTWRDLHLCAPRNTLPWAAPPWWKPLAEALMADSSDTLPWAAPPWWKTLSKALTLDSSGKGVLRYPMRQPPGTPPSAMVQLPGGAKKYIHRPDDFVCLFDLATIHDAAIPPHVGRLCTAESEPGRLVATECWLEHWIPVPEEADPVADGAYCRCDGHCQHEIREPPLAQRHYNIIPGEGRRHWHDDHTCPRAASAACRATSTCNDAGEHGTSIGGWTEHAAALGAVPGALSTAAISNVPAAECEGQVATRSGGASRKVLRQGLLEYFHPGWTAAVAMDAHRWRMLLQARQEGDERVQWHLLLPEDAARLAELEADPPEPLHLLQNKAVPITSRQARKYYYTLRDEDSWATFLQAWDRLEENLRRDLWAAEATSDGTYEAAAPAQAWTDGSLQDAYNPGGGCAACATRTPRARRDRANPPEAGEQPVQAGPSRQRECAHRETHRLQLKNIDPTLVLASGLVPTYLRVADDDAEARSSDDRPTTYLRLWILQGVAPQSLERDLIRALNLDPRRTPRTAKRMRQMLIERERRLWASRS
eukprot:tig00000296_g23922.t1